MGWHEAGTVCKMCPRSYRQADEIERLRNVIKNADEALTAYAKAVGTSRQESLRIQSHDPSWEAWKRLCDTLAEGASTNQ